MSEQIMTIVTPLFQGFLAIALILVSVMLVRVDRKLSALKSGRDGMAAATVELMTACAKAEAAVKALKDGEQHARTALDDQLVEARSLAETLKFLSTTAQAVAGDAQAGLGRAPWRQNERDETSIMRRADRTEHPADALPRSQKVRDFVAGRFGDEQRTAGSARFDWSGLR